MIVEVKDQESGAILFRKDEESLNLENALKRIESLEKSLTKITNRVKTLENASKS